MAKSGAKRTRTAGTNTVVAADERLTEEQVRAWFPGYDRGFYDFNWISQRTKVPAAKIRGQYSSWTRRGKPALQELYAATRAAE